MKLFFRSSSLLATLAMVLLCTTVKAQFMPTDVAGLSVWYAADSNVTTAGSAVTQWDDLSGNANNATQGGAGFQPEFVDSIALLNYHPVIRFDQDYMDFTTVSDIRTVFFVVNHVDGGPVTGTAPLLGHASAVDFYNDGTNVIGSCANNNLKNGTGAINGTATAPTAMLKPVDYSVITLASTGNVTAERITKDRGFNFYWDGDFVEILIYNTPLSDADQDSVETYLFNKYAPPVDLGADINKTYGFCDVGWGAMAIRWIRMATSRP